MTELVKLKSNVYNNLDDIFEKMSHFGVVISLKDFNTFSSITNKIIVGTVVEKHRVIGSNTEKGGTDDSLVLIVKSFAPNVQDPVEFRAAFIGEIVQNLDIHKIGVKDVLCFLSPSLIKTPSGFSLTIGKSPERVIFYWKPTNDYDTLNPKYTIKEEEIDIEKCIKNERFQSENLLRETKIFKLAKYAAKRPQNVPNPVTTPQDVPNNEDIHTSQKRRRSEDTIKTPAKNECCCLRLKSKISELLGCCSHGQICPKYLNTLALINFESCQKDLNKENLSKEKPQVQDKDSNLLYDFKLYASTPRTEEWVNDIQPRTVPVKKKVKLFSNPIGSDIYIIEHKKQPKPVELDQLSDSIIPPNSNNLLDLSDATIDLDDLSSESDKFKTPENELNEPLNEFIQENEIVQPSQSTDLSQTEILQNSELVIVADEARNILEDIRQSTSSTHVTPELLICPNAEYKVAGFLVGIKPLPRIDNHQNIILGFCHNGCKTAWQNINHIKYYNRVYYDDNCIYCNSNIHGICHKCFFNGTHTRVCFQFSFEIKIYDGFKILPIQIAGKEAEKFLECTVEDYISIKYKEIINLFKLILCGNQINDNSPVIVLNVKNSHVPIVHNTILVNSVYNT